MFQKILIANRGEIALRIIRACRELGVRTVAVHSTADSEAMHVKLADESVCIGPPESRYSYLNIPAILSAAEITDAEAIHPGYGFLAENAAFAEMCQAAGIKFIGPTARSIKLMGDKIKARETMIKSGVPVLPGSKNEIGSDDEARKIADEIGYPVIIKAAAGGGGKGMKIVHTPASLISSLMMAKSEAQAAFGNSSVYIEKFCERPRHVEIQLLADNYWNIIHLGERDCSIQRRHQKLIEESPCPVLSDKMRDKMGKAAVEAAQAVNYTNVGTVEFLLDGDNFYFMEMNTRIQVEHPVTEMVTGIDLVKEQIKAAAGEKLKIKQKDIRIKGHSIECRINAEDPVKFIPCPGRIEGYHTPGGPGVRVDSAAYNHYIIPPYYDSMIAKLIVHADSREEAIARMLRALDEYVIEGIKTTIPFHKKLLTDKDFVEGNFDTNFLTRYLG